LVRSGASSESQAIAVQELLTLLLHHGLLIVFVATLAVASSNGG
jgi:hypothetical protein